MLISGKVELMNGAIPKLGRRHRHRSRSRQFDGQRDAVEALADLHDGGRLSAVIEREVRCHAVRAFGKEPHGCGLSNCSDVERGHRPQLFSGDAESFAAGRADPDRRRAREDGVDQVRRSVEQMFAVVEHQQPGPVLLCSSDTLGQRLSRQLGDVECRGNRVGHRVGIGDRGELENPDTSCEFTGEPRGGFQCQPCLAHPANAG